MPDMTKNDQAVSQTWHGMDGQTHRHTDETNSIIPTTWLQDHILASLANINHNMNYWKV